MSSSVHRLNIDDALGRLQSLLWWGANWLNNGYRPNNATGLQRQQFRPSLSEKDLQGIKRQSSPTRALCDLFWDQFNWNGVRSELGNINVFDSGCGRGDLAKRVARHVGGYASYSGIDKKEYPEWRGIEQSDLPAVFSTVNSTLISNNINPEANLFVSQSAIEHFSDDLDYFSQIRDHIKSSGSNTIQIHLFPSRACLKLYRYHGVRQYTRRTVSKITSLFAGPKSYSVLYDLGGVHCNSVHYRYITKPLVRLGVNRKNVEPDQYRAELLAALESDSTETCNDPSFYALVIHSNCREPIFSPDYSRVKSASIG